MEPVRSSETPRRIPIPTARQLRPGLILAAAALACAVAAALIVSRGDDDSALVTLAPDGRFGEDLRLIGLAEAVQDNEVNTALRQLAALHELAALQTLAGLANWPEPYVEPRPVAAAAPAPRAAPRPASPQAWTDATFSAAVLDAVNAERASYGLAPLQIDGRIARASTSYALRMIALGSFGHSVDGSTLTSRLSAAGFTDPVMLGEVIAWSGGPPSPTAIVDMWMNSASHREQILSSNYWRGGAGCAFDGAEVHCVVDLAG